MSWSSNSRRRKIGRRRRRRKVEWYLGSRVVVLSRSYCSPRGGGDGPRGRPSALAPLAVQPGDGGVGDLWCVSRHTTVVTVRGNYCTKPPKLLSSATDTSRLHRRLRCCFQGCVWCCWECFSLSLFPPPNRIESRTGFRLRHHIQQFVQARTQKYACRPSG